MPTGQSARGKPWRPSVRKPAWPSPGTAPEATDVRARRRRRGLGTCFRADPTSEEAATALVRAYLAGGRHALATSTTGAAAKPSKRLACGFLLLWAGA